VAIILTVLLRIPHEAITLRHKTTNQLLPDADHPALLCSCSALHSPLELWQAEIPNPELFWPSNLPQMSEKPVNNSITQLELCNFLTTSELNEKSLHILFDVIKTKIPTVSLVDVALLTKRTLLTLSTSQIGVPFHFNYLHDTPRFTIH